MAGLVANPSRTAFVTREACPGCGATRAQTIFDSPYTRSPIWDFVESYYQATARGIRGAFEGAKFRLDQCNGCTLIYQQQIASEKLMHDLYERWCNEGREPDREFASQIARPKLTRDGHEIFAVAKSLGKPVSELKVFDFGMGWSAWVRTAKALGADASGFEFSATRADYARSKGIRVVSYDEIRKLQVDFINTEQVVEHLPNPLDDLRVLAGALKPNGILKISVPHGGRVRENLFTGDWMKSGDVDGVLMPVHPIEHINCFTPQSLKAIAAHAGLRPVDITLAAGFAFLRESGAVSLRDPKSALKSALRPVYHRLSRTNVYMWFQRR